MNHQLKHNSNSLFAHRVKRRLVDERGASIVIALVFFMICAVVGSVVLTAATVNSQATTTYRQQRQNEFTVSSASQVLANQLRPQAGSTVIFTYEGESTDPSGTELVDFGTNAIGKSIWTWGASGKAYEIWTESQNGRSVEIGKTTPLTVKVADFDTIYARIEVDRDFNVKATLSLDENFDAASPYNEQVELRAIPSYDAKGRLLEIAWEDPIITKVESGPQGG